MKANELRIGNYVHRQSGKMVVNRDDVYKIENVNLQSALKYEPIPLTEEWLLKFGFIKYGHILKIHLNEGLGVNYNKDLKNMVFRYTFYYYCKNSNKLRSPTSKHFFRFNGKRT